MITTAAVLTTLQEILKTPLRTGGQDHRNPEDRVGPHDLLTPADNRKFPGWVVAVYHDAKRMEQRRRYSGRVDERGLSWFLDGNEFTSDDQLIFWHAWKTYGNVELHWDSIVEGETTPELTSLDRTHAGLKPPKD